MNKAIRMVLPILAGTAVGAGGFLAPQSLSPGVPDAPPPPVVEFFGLPSPTADDAAGLENGSGRGRRDRYVPVKGKCVAGFDATSPLQDLRGWSGIVSGEVLLDPVRLEETAFAEILVDARALDTGDKERDRELHRDHLAGLADPYFKFRLNRFQRINPTLLEGPFLAKGTLEVLGKSVVVEFPGTFELRQDGLLHVKGEFRVRMTQFGITPPVAAMVVRVDDEIKVWFEVWAKLEKENP